MPFFSRNSRFIRAKLAGFLNICQKTQLLCIFYFNEWHCFTGEGPCTCQSFLDPYPAGNSFPWRQVNFCYFSSFFKLIYDFFTTYTVHCTGRGALWACFTGTDRPEQIGLSLVSLESFLKVVTNEKGEAVGEVVTIIYQWGRWCLMFFCHFNGLPSCMNSYLSFRQ